MSLPVDLRTQQELKRVVFTSRMTTEDKDDAEMALSYIFKIGEERNKRDNICGMLYYNNDTFNVVQLMEGPVDKVNALFTDIAQDTRHTRVSRVLEERIETKEKWFETVGLVHGTPDHWSSLKHHFAKKKTQGNFSDTKMVDLEAIDQLPIAGDLDMRLIRLVYHSEFKEKSEFRAFFMMQDIVEAAQRKNERLLIGGALHMNKKTFDVFQCLEGPANAVKTLYCAIENDSRHSNVETLLLEQVDKRRYKTWGMVWANDEAKKVLKESLPSHILDGVGKKFV